jgi:hypothetical protein
MLGVRLSTTHDLKSTLSYACHRYFLEAAQPPVFVYSGVLPSLDYEFPKRGSGRE